MRKLASIFLALLMVFLCIPSSTVSAETTSPLEKDYTQSSGYTWLHFWLHFKNEVRKLLSFRCFLCGFRVRVPSRALEGSIQNMYTAFFVIKNPNLRII